MTMLNFCFVCCRFVEKNFSFFLPPSSRWLANSGDDFFAPPGAGACVILTSPPLSIFISGLFTSGPSDHPITRSPDLERFLRRSLLFFQHIEELWHQLGIPEPCCGLVQHGALRFLVPESRLIRAGSS